MKNSTLVRIKVPKALYESALKKALSDSNKATPEKAKASIQKQEKDHNKKTNDMIAKARAEARAAEAKKKKIKEATQIEKFNTLTPNREIHKDSHRMQDKKRIKEGLPFGVTPDMVSDVLKVLAGMGAIAGGSVAITKWHDLLKKKSPELFNKLASIRSTAGAANDALNLENKKKKVEEKKKY